MGARFAMMRLGENSCCFSFGPGFTIGQMSRERQVPATRG